MALSGKGFFIWKIPYCEGGDSSAIAARAVEANLTHVLIKIADGSNWAYNYDYKRGVDLIPPVMQALRDRGVQVWGWQYVRGDDPVGEARLAVQRGLHLGIDGFVIDAEGEYKHPGKDRAARVYVQELRAGFPNLPIALSSYRYPQYHPEVPYEAFLAACDYNMPQVYFEEAHNPESQLERSVAQYQNLRPARPIIPTAPTYSTSAWRPSGDEISRFLSKAKDIGLAGVNAWSWDYASRSGFYDLWDAVAEFDWPASAPKMDISEELILRMNQHDAQLVADLYHDNAAHVTGARTVVGKEPIKEWYSSLFTQMLPKARFTLTGRSGTGVSRHLTWTAKGESVEVLDGSDTLGIREGKIQYHYTRFTVG